MEKILITGGTGLIGKNLSKKLKDKGYQVNLLSRENKLIAGFRTYKWNLNNNEIEKDALLKTDYIIHLAGVGIADKRWTAKRKQIIADSRIKSCHLIFNKLKEYNCKPKAFICSSAIGYYGMLTTENIFEETDAHGKDFLGETCQLWEKAADQFNEFDIRIVKIRTGQVLTKEGGVLGKMKLPVKMGLASAFGNGKQYMPWIHIDDLCDIYIKSIEDTQMNGVYNAVAPEHITNRDFIKTIAHVLKKPFWFPNIPSVVLKLILGKMADILINGSRVSSEKIRKAGFSFRFPNLKRAITDLLIKKIQI